MTLGDTSSNPTVIAKAYRIAERLAIDLGLYVYTYDGNNFWYWRSWLGGVSMQENPVVGGSSELLFYWVTKGVTWMDHSS